MSSLSIKQIIYKSVLDYASFDCKSWANQFEEDAIVYLPGAANSPEKWKGRAQIEQHCQSSKLFFLGQGAYPHDMYISNDGSRAIFPLHIRGVTKEQCHVDFPGILQIDINNGSGLIRKWTHYFDGDWMLPMLNCKSKRIPKDDDNSDDDDDHPLKLSVRANSKFAIKSEIYETLLNFNTECASFASKFEVNGNYSSPAGAKIYSGFSQIEQRCKEINAWFTGAGNYAHDMYIGDNVATFQWHIRAINDYCHISWPGIVRIQFNEQGKILDFTHFYDEDWTMAAVNCPH